MCQERSNVLKKELFDFKLSELEVANKQILIKLNEALLNVNLN